VKERRLEAEEAKEVEEAKDVEELQDYCVGARDEGRTPSSLRSVGMTTRGRSARDGAAKGRRRREANAKAEAE
jgi:hypothetical protein